MAVEDITATELVKIIYQVDSAISKVYAETQETAEKVTVKQEPATTPGKVSTTTDSNNKVPKKNSFADYVFNVNRINW